MTFAKGQRVHVEFDGTITALTSKDDDNEYVPVGQGYSDNFGGWGFVEVMDANHIKHTVWVNGDSVELGSEVITANEPTSWPPRPGDIWTADDKEYFITSVERIDGFSPRVYFAHNIRTDDGVTYGNSNLSFVLFQSVEPELIRRLDS